MAGRLRRSMFRLSSIKRPFIHGGSNSRQDSGPYPSTSKESSMEPRARSPSLSPKRESVAASPMYSVKKVASPSPSPSYGGSAGGVINSQPKAVDEYLKDKPTTQPRSPETEPKAVVGKAMKKVIDSDCHGESSKTTMTSHKHEPNTIKIAGENHGAVMEIFELKGEGGDMIEKKETFRRTSNRKAKDQNKEGCKEKKGESTYLNSNVQGVNNSILYGASLAHHDPVRAKIGCAVFLYPQHTHTHMDSTRLLG
ncbi:uncharacterized protein LOC111475114 isoform X1 [Cucurbita maxima]|uniref:Uncharacterized protein LOC111473597 isoform X2 n=1 Tax=Cucurbita maxima TaxID=3661 RepID=A0A6J1IBA2_CUCMA|nr:uncharacterized protein LOC111473597 isoform X2 [Cucurbita maxima]XP_022975567.1 uncharacterized protein LOC111475114 isoform X1 [Cucurbita maxima]